MEFCGFFGQLQGKPKIRDNDSAFIREQNIRSFDISMENVLFMQIFNSQTELPKDHFELAFVKLNFLLCQTI